MSDEKLAELQDATAAFYLNLRTAMKEIHALTTDPWIDGRSVSMSERLDRIELISEKAIEGAGETRQVCGAAIITAEHIYRCTKESDHG